MKSKRILSIVLCFVMMLTMSPMTVFAGTESVSFRMSVSIASGTTTPGHYGVEYQVVDAGGNSVQGDNYSYGYSNGNWPDNISLSNLESSYQVKITVTSAGLGVRLNGADVTNEGWLDGKVISLTELNDRNYEFELFERGNNPNPGEGTGGEVANPGEFYFNCRSEAVTGGSIYYKKGNAADFTKVSEDGQYGVISLGDDDTSLTIKFVPNTGYELDATRGVELLVNGTSVNKDTGNNVNDYVSEAGYTFNLGTIDKGGKNISQSSFELVFGFGSENGGGTGNVGPEGPGGPQGNTEATINYSYEGEGACIVINGSQPQGMSAENGHENSFNIRFDANEEDTHVDMELGILFINAFTEININGTDYSDLIPKTDEELVEAFSTQNTWVKIRVPRNRENGKDVYTISTKAVEASPEKIAVGNFLWTYDENEKYLRNPDGTIQKDENGNDIVNDDYIDHGHLELIGIDYNGKTYSGSELSEKIQSGTAFDWGENEEDKIPVRGGATLPAGATVTVKLVPEYGYQLTDFSINGGSFGVGDEQSVFSFEIKRGNFHLAAHFTKVEDAVNAVSDKVKEGTIELGGQEINSGSVVLSVEDVTLSSEQISNFEDKAGEYSISSYLDINLNQVIYKGTDNADDAWKTELKELNNKADITLKLEQGVNGNEVVIVHEKHDGDFEIISATYNAATNMIAFKTDSFSNYAIAVMDMSDVPDVPDVPNVPNVPDDSDDSDDPDESAEPETKSDSSNTAEKIILTKTDGSVAKDEWVMKNGKWYYAGDKGTAETGWFKDESSGKWYYL
ncbi:MAG: hypothetical protein J5986_03675, partial [Roseburia sp.]|nr:hypothetical protein [Roseburia sp.]